MHSQSREAALFLKQLDDALKQLAARYNMGYSRVSIRVDEEKKIIDFTARIVIDKREYVSTVSAENAIAIGPETVAANLIGQGIGQFHWYKRK